MNTTVKKIFCFLYFALFLATTSYAQISIGTPNLGFSQICTDATYNATKPFTVSFSFSPVSGLNSSNQFIVELSDASGNFTTPTTLVSSNQGAITTSPATLNFSVPTTMAGEQYKIRIRSTSPAATSTNSVSFSAYYQIQNSPFSINNFVPTATYCPGGNYVLKIDNPGTGTNDSPLKYPALTYKWFKEPSLTPIATTSSLTVNQAGTYYVETNYGSCTSNSYSNRVSVSEASGQSASITSSLGNPFCSNGNATTLTTQTGNSYKWYKNNVLISGANSNTYTTNEEGLYSVNVDFGSCISTATINLQKVKFTSSLNISETYTLSEGETKNVITTTDAVNPSYRWYLDDVAITGATAASLNINQMGNYKVIITQNSGCISYNEMLFTINSFIDSNAVTIPNLISPNSDGINDTWVIPQEYTSGTNTEIIMMNSSGELVFKTDNYLNNWPESILNFKNINPVYYYIIRTKDGKVKKGSITVVK
ncbi:gliding motility-associated C-terminal domain-containing protein [Flavobacterium sufflavum]|uniref:Gliding motility-associated C-terminal domain-containing protein n=1 Tax=Flavobacterium sufflavum TaxID=1921138 RepID=A0A3S2WHN2_9FLAO|nr:gliding motility-associated C-terminal domain-containing protein [Flavobacterium sufflavum]RVT79891.1 gliding motility-associated C-terminal domain-containing protein [Flavobacterium sufflavum]